MPSTLRRPCRRAARLRQISGAWWPVRGHAGSPTCCLLNHEEEWAVSRAPPHVQQLKETDRCCRCRHRRRRPVTESLLASPRPSRCSGWFEGRLREHPEIPSPMEAYPPSRWCSRENRCMSRHGPLLANGGLAETVRSQPHGRHPQLGHGRVAVGACRTSRCWAFIALITPVATLPEPL